MFIFTFLTDQIMLPFLNYSYSIIPNYGFAIILLTLVIKMAFYPLTKKQFEAMKMSQKIQPILKDLQAQYKSEPQKLQQEMMKVWKEHKVNPLGGCLPMLVQIPFFFAIFYTVTGTAFKEILAQPDINTGLFSFWLSNLAMPDKTFILPIVIGIATYLSQKMMTIDPKQAVIFMFMPFLMAFISLQMPAGALLYWAVSTIVSVIQQYMISSRSQSTEDTAIEVTVRTKS
jgi:YidC/Oxa1 family membrane protein insertase